MFWLVVIIGVVGLWIVHELFLRYPSKPANIKKLDRKSYAIICAIGEVFLPHGGAIELSAKEAKVPEFIDNYIASLPKIVGKMMTLLFYLMEHATYIFAFSINRLSRMDLNKRIKYFDGWENSRFYLRRLVFMSLRGIYGMAYISNPEVQAAMDLRINKKCCEGLIIKRRQR